MFNRQADETLFFSTKVELKINNTLYRPSICYKVPALAKASILQKEKEGKVVIYKTPVRFVNGAVVYPPSEQSSAGVSSIKRETEAQPVSRRKNK